jgi:RecA-family ATPase
MENIQRNFKRSKFLINKLSVNGKIYFKLKCATLKQKDENTFYNTNSPLRNDKKPSLSITRDPSTNIWYYHDFGRPDSRGDLYSFAAECYNLDVVKDFPLVLDKIYDDLQVDSFDVVEIQKFLDGEQTKIDFSSIIGKNDAYIDYKNQPEEKEVDYSFLLWEKTEKEWSIVEKNYLDRYGITAKALEATNTVIISGYGEAHGFKTKYRYPKEGEIWLAYKCGKGAKIYSPKPKKFWWVGKSPKKYIYGTPVKDPYFEDLTNVFLVGGEKDVLTLMSRGFKAMCLSSETKSVDRRDLKGWYFECHYRIIVMYDIDDTGIKQAKKINEECGLKYIMLPSWLKEKGGKDISDFFLLGGTVEELNTIINEQINEIEQLSGIEVSNNNRLEVRTASQRMEDARKQADILPLFGFFLQRGELVIMFGDTGKGKSIAAVSLADAITKGYSFLGLENAYGPLTVLYYDFELSDKQFEKRYSNDVGEVYLFSDNFFIDNLDLSEFVPKTKSDHFENLLIDKIRRDVDSTKAEVVIIDNITFLTTHSAEDSQVALTLMRLLKELKTEKNISILVLAHTPKKTNPFGITLQDLAGSKHIPNFADGVFALGYSTTDSGLRYFIQVKPSRSGEWKYDKENVLVCEIQKMDNLLTLIPKRFCAERELLRETDSENEEKLIEKAKKMKAEGTAYQKIADELGLSKSKVGRWLKDS